VTGRIGDSDDTRVTVLPTEASGGPVTVAYDDIESAHVEVEFGHPAVADAADDGAEDA
jgi:hypothetical protein